MANYHTTSSVTHPDGWVNDCYSDGTEQWYINPVTKHLLFIERVAGSKSRRKRWTIVGRDGAAGENTMYPPKVSGPFPNLKSAKAAYLVIINSR